MTTQNKIDFEEFQKAWRDYPSQDNEGYIPDRGGFKCGWFAALYYERENTRNLKQQLEIAVEALNKLDAKTHPIFVCDKIRFEALEKIKELEK